MNTHDLIIIGGGPAGYSAALYGARASLDTFVIERGMPGGQIATSDLIDNYPGIPECSGAELGQRFADHADRAGATSTYGAVQRIARDDEGWFTLETDMESYRARAVIVATGANPRKAGFEGEDTFRGRGVSYCATCDGMFYHGKHVFIIGGGNTAVEEALYLSKIAERVELIVRKPAFRASQGMVGRLLVHENISVRYQTRIARVSGDTLIQSITFEDTTTGVQHDETFDAGAVGIFVATGHDPATELVQDLVELAPDGGVITDARMATSTPGLYCAGDLRSTPLRQVITATSDGVIAAVSAYQFLEEHGYLS